MTIKARKCIEKGNRIPISGIKMGYVTILG